MWRAESDASAVTWGGWTDTLLILQNQDLALDFLFLFEIWLFLRRAQTETNGRATSSCVVDSVGASPWSCSWPNYFGGPVEFWNDHVFGVPLLQTYMCTEELYLRKDSLKDWSYAVSSGVLRGFPVQNHRMLVTSMELRLHSPNSKLQLVVIPRAWEETPRWQELGR